MKTLLTLLLAVLSSIAISAPCTKTVSAGGNIQTVVTGAVAGDVICLRGGTYSTNNVTVTASGTSGSHITIKEYPGEVPVIDGAGIMTPEWQTMIYIRGSYIDLSGITVKNGVAPYIKGIWLSGNNISVKNMTVDNVQGQGILVTGNSALVENNTVSRAAMSNLDCAQCATVTWPFAVGTYLNYNTANVVTGLVIRGNTVHDSWGEGIQNFQTDGALIESNTIYNNFSANLYIVACRNAIVRKNIVYNKPGAETWADGIVMADEQLYVLSHDNQVYNNLIFNADSSLYSWTNINNTGLVNVLFAHNILINSKLNTGAWGGQNITNSGSSIRNNIIYRDDTGVMGTIPSATGITFGTNVWYPTRPANATGTGDVVGSDPKIAKAGSTGSGQLTAAYFKVLYGTPAKDAGVYLPNVPADYFNMPRANPVVIGAHELTCQ
jgi:hypothetical protein